MPLQFLFCTHFAIQATTIAYNYGCKIHLIQKKEEKNVLSSSPTTIVWLFSCPYVCFFPSDRSYCHHGIINENTHYWHRFSLFKNSWALTKTQKRVRIKLHLLRFISVILKRTGVLAKRGRSGLTIQSVRFWFIVGPIKFLSVFS